MNTQEKIQKVIKTIPKLTDFGIGLFEHNLSKSEYDIKFRNEQNQLLSNVEEFEKVSNWLKSVEKIQSINRRHTSYGLKHIAEKSIGYSTNGIFIAAAIHAGFEYKIIDGGPNVQFNMSEKSLKKLDPYCNKDVLKI